MATRKNRRIRFKPSKRFPNNRRKVGRTRKGKTTVRAVKAIVKREIAKNLENKYITQYQLGDAQLNSYVLGSNPNVASGWITQGVISNQNFYLIFPSIVQGDQSNQRQGTIIRPKSLRSYLQFSLNNSKTSSQNIQVRVIALTFKQMKSYEAFLGNQSSSTPVNYANKLCWDGGTASSVPVPGGEPEWMRLPINKREINVVMDKTFTLSKGAGLNRVSNPPQNGTITTMLPTQSFEEVSINWDVPKSLKYNDNTSTAINYPTNYAPFICCYYTQMDGYMSQDPQYNTQVITLNMRTSLSYEDA